MDVMFFRRVRGPSYRTLTTATLVGLATCTFAGCSSSSSASVGSGGAAEGMAGSPGGSGGAAGGVVGRGGSGASGHAPFGGTASGGSPGSGGAGPGGAPSNGGTGTGGTMVGRGGDGTGGLPPSGGAPTGGSPGNAGTDPGGSPVTAGTSAGGWGVSGSWFNGGAADDAGGSPGSGGSGSGGADDAGGAAAGGDETQGGSPESGGSNPGGSTGECQKPTPGTTGQNPITSEVYTADPAAFVHDCTFYITCGHDEGDGTRFDMYEWFILKSTDMVNWTRTVGMSYTTFSWAYGNAWAGQMVTKNGKFYWYVPVEQAPNGQMAIGVAVADSPEGPFEDALGHPLVDDAFERENMGFATDGDTPYTIDPTVFVDIDGQAYLHYGGFQTLVNARLGDDMVSIDGTMQISTPDCYFESPYLIRRGDTWYEIYACGINPPTIDYATSDSPLGPWQHQGTILPVMDTLPGQDWATNHAGVAEFAGDWYIVYHVSDGPNGGGTYHREVAIDKLTFNDDGSIQPTTPTDGMSF